MTRGRKPLTPAQVAARLEISASQAQRYITSGLLPSFKTPNGRRWVLPEDLEAFKRARTEPIAQVTI